ncbi:MAG: DNA glycosylase, partial [Thermoleophilaceae bacterium]|nr:DNA glycosylase [Thermoleophilaceae bacterium]
WRRLDDLTDEERVSVVRRVRPPMLQSVEARGETRRWVYERSGLPCRRCGTRVRARGQGDDNRTTYWCPRCQT